MKNTIIILLVFLIQSKIQSQNLIINGDFEAFKDKNLRESIGITGTPDFYEESDKDFKSPKFIEGEVCLGLCFGTYWTEGIQLKLKEPLKKNVEYKISMQVFNQNFSCPFGLNTVTCSLLEFPFKTSRKTVALKIKPIELRKKDNSIIKDGQNWIDLSTNFVANGNEKYFILGSMGGSNLNIIRMNDTLSLTGSSDMRGCQYIYYDNISLVEVKPKIAAIELPKDTIIKNILFKFNSHIIEDNSFADLDVVINIFNARKKNRITILGHTDNTGTPQSNLILSQKRAQSVKDYFIRKGIKSDKIQTEGLGSSKPLNGNSNLIDQALNRRVEFVFE
jgi:outer membrane protein OmpA-like peptidoglycan-associated protein